MFMYLNWTLMCVQRKQTALHMAVGKRHKEVVLALLDRGANLQAEDEVRGRSFQLPTTCMGN
jgi:hypothetical protein